MRTLIKKHTSLLGLLLFTAAAVMAAEQVPVERFALYVASSRGGAGRDVLKYAGSDAKKVASAMREIGGIKDENSLMLVDPAKRELEKAFETVKNRVQGKKSSARRTEFVFYYSGHSDESSLLLGTEEYPYTLLKKSLTAVNADVEVVMLDSCYSGNFVRTKGGSREKPFLFDDSTIVKGHAYLSSSSESEASQEADSIQSSYFTYALVTGMRGAADTTGDGRVSLNELYHYAFNDTLSRTEFSKAGPQHPSYNITLVGSGDLVLTDVSQSESAIVLGGATEGRYFIRTASGTLIAEVNKIAGTDIALALSAGEYVISIVSRDITAQKTLTIERGMRVLVDGTGFTNIPLTKTVSRGNTSEENADAAGEANSGETESENAEKQKKEPMPAVLNIGFWPGFGLNLVSKSPDAIVSFNLFGAKQRTIYGMQFSIFCNIATGNMHGLQFNGIFNNTRQAMRGAQIAGLVNMAGPGSWGLQLGGLVNTVKGSFSGTQIGGLVNVVRGQFSGIQLGGLVNVAQDFYGFQIGGLVNTAQNFRGLQIVGLVNVTQNFSGFQLGGLLNTTKNASGFQLGGLGNVARGSFKGFQMAGLFNYAEKLDGAQFGVINIAKEARGFVFGVFNFILDGIMSPAVYVDSSKTMYVQYQNGTNWFYNILYAGTAWDFSGSYLTYGLGVGTRLPIGKYFSFDFDVSAKAYQSFRRPDTVKIVQSRAEFTAYEINVLPSFRVSFNFSPFKHFSIFGGAAMDLDFTNCVPQAAASPMKFGNNTVTVHPSFFAGLKF